MGAEIFEYVGPGKNAREAFDNAVSEALYWHGHGGYTGTIAEKSGFQLFECPEDVTAEQLMHWADGNTLTGVPEKYHNLVTNMQNVFDDKWGPAVCIQLKGKELADARAEYCKGHNIKKTTMNFFLFGGWAST